MKRLNLEQTSTFLASLLEGLQDTVTACAAQKKQCPLTCSQRKGFVESAQAIISVAQQILEEEDDLERSVGSRLSGASASSPSLADHADTSTIAVLHRQLDAVHSDGKLLTQFIQRYHPDAKLEPGASPTVTTSRVADLLKVKQTFRTMEINLHDVEQLLRIVYSRVFATPATSPTGGSGTFPSPHSSELTLRPGAEVGAAASRYAAAISEDEDEDAHGEEAAATRGTAPGPRTPSTTTGVPSPRNTASAGTASPGVMSRSGTDIHESTGMPISPPVPSSVRVADGQGNEADVAGEGQGRRTQKMSAAGDVVGPDGAAEEEEEPEARPVEATLSGHSGAPPPRSSTNTLPYVRGSRSQVMPSVSLTRSELELGGDSTDGDYSGPRMGSPRYERGEDADEDEEEGLTSITPRASARLFHGVPPGLPPSGLPPTRADALRSPVSASAAAAAPTVTAPPSLERKKGRLVTTQHSHRMPGEIWVSLCEEIPDEVEACFIEDVLGALNTAQPTDPAPRPVIADAQILDVRLSSLAQFLYIRFAVEHDRYEYPKKDIDARVAAYGYPMLTQLYEEAFHVQRAREEADLAQFDSGDDVFMDVVSTSRSRRGSSSQRRRDSIHSINSALLGDDAEMGDGSPLRPDNTTPGNSSSTATTTSGSAVKPLRLAVPMSVAADTTASSMPERSSTSLPSESKTVSASALPASEQAGAGASFGTFPAANTSTSMTSTETAGAYCVRLPGRHWPTVLFFVSKPMMRPVMVEEVALATGVALKAVVDMKLSVGSLCADFCLDASAASETVSATEAPAVWPSCSEYVMRALESHDFALIHQQYTTACRDLFLESDLPESSALFAQEVLGPHDVRDSREGSGPRAASAASAAPASLPAANTGISATAPVSYFTLPAVEELDESIRSLPRSTSRPSPTTRPAPGSLLTLPATGTGTDTIAGKGSRTHRSSSSAVRGETGTTSPVPLSYSYASSSVAGRPDTPDNEPITLLHLALENDVTVAQLRAYNPQLTHLDDDDPIPEDDGLAINVPRPTWLYEEEDAALESIASGTPMASSPRGDSASPITGLAASGLSSASDPVASAIATGGSPSATASAPRRTSVHASHTTARQESVSSVASSTGSTPSSATARLRNRQKLRYVDPAAPVVVADVAATVETPAEEVVKQREASAEAVASSVVEAPIPEPPAAPAAPAVPAVPAPAQRVVKQTRPSASGAPTATIIAHVTSAYPHLTTPGSNSTYNANPSPTAQAAAAAVVAELPQTAAPRLSTTNSAPTPVAVVATPSVTSSVTPQQSQQPVLPSPIARPRPFAGSGDGDGSRRALTSASAEAMAQAHAPHASHPPQAPPVPTRGHPKSPPPALAAQSSASMPPPTPTPTSAPVAGRAGRLSVPMPRVLPRPSAALPAATTVPGASAGPTGTAAPLAVPPTAATLVVSADGRPRLGVRLDKNLIVASVTVGSAAAESGMTVGAQLRTVNGKPLHTSDDFQRVLRHAAAQPLPSVLLITTARPSAEAQGAAWSESDEAPLPPSTRELKTHWIRLLSDPAAPAPPSPSATPTTGTASLPSPRTGPARPPQDGPIHAEMASPSSVATTARAAAYQRVRSHSAHPPAVGSRCPPAGGAAAVTTTTSGGRPRSGRVPRSSSGMTRPHGGSGSARTASAGPQRQRPRQDSLDEGDQPAPRSAVPLPTPMQATHNLTPSANATEGAGAKIMVRSRSARKGSRDAQ